MMYQTMKSSCISLWKTNNVRIRFMKNLGHLKSYSMKLTTITPIYIGGGEYYN